jgi:MFS family permease
MFAQVDRILRPQGFMFYGWYIVGAGAGLQMLSGLLWMQSYGAYVVLLQDEFGWSSAWVAGAFALTRIESGILGPLQGWLVDRFGPRAILRIGIVIFGFGFIMFSQVNDLLTFYLTFGLIALGASLGGFATVMVAIVNWFSRHRSKAVALSLMGYSVGGMSVPIVILCLESFGWRTTAMLSGLLVLIVGLPLAQLVRHKPETTGDAPDGMVTVDEDGQPTVGGLSAGVDFTAKQAMRTSAFWLISIGHACSLLTVSTVMVHLVPHLTGGLNYTLSQAGLVVALMTGSQMIGQLSGGYLGDRVSKRLICVGCMVGHAAALFMVAHATSLAMVIGFAVLYGISWGTRGPMMVALRADYFGASSFGTIIGFSSLVAMLGMSSGPIIAGYLADLHGNYETGFTILAAGAFLGSFAFLFALPPKHSSIEKPATE